MYKFMTLIAIAILISSCAKFREVDPVFDKFSFVYTGSKKGKVLGTLFLGSHEVLKYGLLVSDKPDIYLNSSISAVKQFYLDDKEYSLEFDLSWTSSKTQYIKVFALTNSDVFYSPAIEIKDSLYRQIAYKNGNLMFARSNYDVTFAAAFPVNGYFQANDSADGQLNQQKLYQAYKAGPIAYCEDLVLGGYDDWYLPAYQELKFLFQNRDYFEILTNSNRNYLTSTELDSFSFVSGNPKTGKFEEVSKNTLIICRCIRRN